MDAIIHHHLDVEADEEVEVWADRPTGTEAPRVTLYISGADTLYLALSPTETCALAALLVLAAEQQEKRIAGARQ